MADTFHDKDRRSFLSLGAGLGALAGTTALGALLDGGTALAQGASATPAAAGGFRLPPPPPGLVEGFVQIPGGGRIAYQDTGGRGQPLLLAHAATGSIRSWPYQLGALKMAGYRAIAWSRAGFLPSDPAGSTPPAHEIDALIDELKLGKVHLLGTAAGGMLALDYALEKPGRLRSLILACSGMATDHPVVAAGWKRLLPPGFNQMPAEFRELGPSYRATNPEGTEAWRAVNRASRLRPRPAGGEGARPGGGEGARPAGGAAGGTEGGTESLGGILARQRPKPAFEALAGTGLPILLMTGDCDLYMPPALLREVGKLIPRARLAIINDAGHSANWEQPEAFNRAVLNFLRTVKG